MVLGFDVEYNSFGHAVMLQFSGTYLACIIQLEVIKKKEGKAVSNNLYKLLKDPNGISSSHLS